MFEKYEEWKKNKLAFTCDQDFFSECYGVKLHPFAIEMVREMHMLRKDVSLCIEAINELNEKVDNLEVV